MATKTTKIGIILILVGIFVPLVLYPFVTLRKDNFVPNPTGLYKEHYIGQSEIVLRKGCYIDETEEIFNHTAIPYKYIISFGIAFIGIGTGIFGLSIISKKI